MNPEALYTQLGRLIEEMPHLESGPLDKEAHLWLGRADALVATSQNGVPDFTLQAAIADLVAIAPFSGITADNRREAAIGKITTVLFRALAAAEMKAPAAMSGAFITAGSPFDAFTAIGKVLNTATADVLIIDPYMDEKVLTDFAPLAPEGVALRLLADQQSHKPTLSPAATRWVAQFAGKRPLSVRLAGARTLHDRAIIIDTAKAWTLTQSLNAFATRSPASIVKVDGETAALKIAAYEGIWSNASILV